MHSPSSQQREPYKEKILNEDLAVLTKSVNDSRVACTTTGRAGLV